MPPGDASITRLRGRVVFAPGVPTFTDRVVTVSLERTSMIDAAAETVAECSLQGSCFHGSSGESVGFELPVGDLNPKERYSLRVVVDLDGDGRLSPGDLTNVESTPVASSDSKEIIVQVQAVD